MSILHRTRREPAPEQKPDAHTAPPAAQALQSQVKPDGRRSTGRSRAGAAWIAVCAAAVIAVALIIFMVQNTGSTEISFLWMTTTASLAVALLIGALGATLLTLILGSVRITQLRRRLNRRNR